MDLLADSREVIRNDVSPPVFHFITHREILVGLMSHVVCLLQGLLLLQQLTRGNAAIQKIVAFENAFERLLDIITEEGSSDGGEQSRACRTAKTLFFFFFFVLTPPPPSFAAGIVVEDCLLLLLNLLKNNSSNQNFFKEGSYIQRMKPWFEVGDDNSGWSAQKVTNLHLMLQVAKAAFSFKSVPSGL